MQQCSPTSTLYCYITKKKMTSGGEKNSGMVNETRNLPQDQGRKQMTLEDKLLLHPASRGWKEQEMAQI